MGEVAYQPRSPAPETVGQKSARQEAANTPQRFQIFELLSKNLMLSAETLTSVRVSTLGRANPDPKRVSSCK